MSATRLLVLGVVRMYGRAHGYQVRRELQRWSADKWGNAAPGSIYHALKKMSAERLLEEIADESAPKGPERVAYQLTDQGDVEFIALLSKYLAEPEEGTQDAYALTAAITFITALPRARAISLLEHRVTQMAGQRANLVSMLERAADWGQPEHATELYHLWLAQLGAAIGWAEDLVERLRAGTYAMADESHRAFGARGALPQS